MPNHEDDWDDWRPNRRSRMRLWPFGLIVIVLAFGAGVETRGMFGGLSQPIYNGLPSTGNAQQNPPNSGSPSALSPVLTSGNTVTQIYRSAIRSIVTITAVSSTNSKSGPQEDIGTGFFFDSQGDLATNAHVVNGQTSVTVQIGTKTYTGKVLGADTMDDLAVIHVEGLHGQYPPALQLGTAKSLQPGDQVIAIGNPFQLTSSVTSGIISGLNRSMPAANGREMVGLVQTDASLNPGNSGGPLIDASGQVVGINTAIESPIEGSVGIGFAIPIDRFKRLAPQLLSGQKIDQPWLGIEGLDLDAGLEQTYGLPVNQGVLVVAVTKNGPAANAGLRPDSGGTNNPKGDGDIIIGINGKPITNVSDLTADIANKAIGSKVQMNIIRNGKKMTLTVTLGSWLHH